MKYKYLPHLPKYRIYDNGKIFSEYTDKFISYYKNEAGYYMARLMTGNNINRLFRIHTLIACAWVENENPKRFKLVNHIDGDKENINKSNLEWSDYKHNNNHACISGINTRKRKCSVKLISGEVVSFDCIKYALKHFKKRSLAALRTDARFTAVSVEASKTTFNDKILIRCLENNKEILVVSLSAASSFTGLNRTGIKKRLERSSMLPLKGYQFKLLGDKTEWKNYSKDELCTLNNESGQSKPITVFSPEGKKLIFPSIKKFFIAINHTYSEYWIRKLKRDNKILGYTLHSLSK